MNLSLNDLRELVYLEDELGIAKFYMSARGKHPLLAEKALCHAHNYFRPCTMRGLHKYNGFPNDLRRLNDRINSNPKYVDLIESINKIATDLKVYYHDGSSDESYHIQLDFEDSYQHRGIQTCGLIINRSSHEDRYYENLYWLYRDVSTGVKYNSWWCNWAWDLTKRFVSYIIVYDRYTSDEFRMYKTCAHSFFERIGYDAEIMLENH